MPGANAISDRQSVERSFFKETYAVPVKTVPRFHRRTICRHAVTAPLAVSVFQVSSVRWGPMRRRSFCRAPSITSNGLLFDHHVQGFIPAVWRTTRAPLAESSMPSPKRLILLGAKPGSNTVVLVVAFSLIHYGKTFRHEFARVDLPFPERTMS